MMTSSPEPCPRSDCRGGHIMVTGFCGTCARRPPAPVRGLPARPAAGPARSSHRSAAPAAAPALDRDGLLVLPRVPSPDPSEVAGTIARSPSGGRRCGVDNCTATIGVSYDGGPAPDHGFCTACGAEYSFMPKLHPGDRVGGHYRVLGYLAVGGLGWVHLAEDTRVPDLLVVLKGLINTGDAVARRSAVEERRSLTTLHHRDIVRIVTYVHHQVPGEKEPTGYIVMEYVGGRSLAWIRHASDEELARLFGGSFEFGHVLTYGCKILGAFEYLHDQGLLYCDMKPDNVIHYGREIKVIDLGAIRRIDDRSSSLVYTPDYAPPKTERDERGFQVDTDLYTVGRTLKTLAVRALPAAGLAARSFDALIRRATHPEPAARFTSAAEMSRQLWEVLREHQALSGHEPYPERSTCFEPTAALFGSALGTVPALDHWTRRSSSDAPELPIGAPEPRDAARALPVPVPDPRDAAAVLLGGLAADNPERVAEQAERDSALYTVETALWLCRAYLDAGDVDKADRWVGKARGLSRDYDWRIFWHQGLLHLTSGQVREAECEFAATYATLPGESAPKLALGYCAEHLAATAGAGERQTEEYAEYTEEYYEAVWRRDRTQGSAAFGLARIHLRRGDREEAVGVLDEVPTTSRHYDAARVAAIRVLTGRLPGAGPTAAQLGEAAERLQGLRRPPTTLHLDGSGAWDRLVTEVRGHAVTCRPPGGWGPDFPAGELFGPADTPRALGELLSRSLKRLADQAGSTGERGDLLDRAYATLPETVGLRELLRGWRRTV
ncbi:tetratricopeptide repeat protein [Streptomyces sp. GQFP]|uniref:tetratricopeptide repeat protein n=1 Tax=Streptomyces sp. GQFP TaxID=2907545 RepID=UPI001F2DB3DF|nr:tetratricopeptide repeat protein [Streptomyces sp. GQFP]UIX30101.1 protein kinase [Streptomyces sp. GQFP]